ncbi:MAG: 50S ribosomal protein L4 [Rhodospirillaceae bacterium]|nr:50S ribosomal protein L4 [Rhodospirillaceae bacterium]|tara:strand:+ start:1197 stop:1817 length:621 start_codon:yes stop_codon:yes gene_type:complete
MKINITNLDSVEVGEIELKDEVFGTDIRADLMHRYVQWQLAKRRAGTHKVKGRSEIRGTTAKMYKQKGTGRARHGTSKVSQFRGGGVTFGPVSRDHGHKLPKKVRKRALCCALSSKKADGKLFVIDSINIQDAKTKVLAEKFSKLGWESVLIISGSEIDVNFQKAAKNIPGIYVIGQQGANVYDILRRETLILTREAVEQLEARLT